MHYSCILAQKRQRSGRRSLHAFYRTFRFITVLTGARKSVLLRWGFVSPSPKTQAWAPSLIGCLRLLILYIRSYPGSKAAGAWSWPLTSI